MSNVRQLLMISGCDPPDAEFWLFQLAVVFVPILLIALFKVIKYKKWSMFLKVILVLLILSAPAIYSIAERHFGEWAELRKLMIDYSHKVNEYEKTHGKITNYEEKYKFYELYPPPKFKFSGSKEALWIVYLHWIDSEHKIGISWNGNNCAINLKTMVIVYGD